jgi:cytosine/adenosine deaminase-related metal-dependent hydrolase
MSDGSGDRVSGRWREALTRIRSGDRVRLTARWIFPIASDPIEHGLLEIADGRVESVEPLSGRSCTDAMNLGNSAILPALVNAHAHLEFSDLAEPIQPPAPFSQWIQNLMGHRRSRPESVTESALSARGARESARCGTAIVGDIVTGAWTPEPVTSGSDVVAFRELIGLLVKHKNPQLDVGRKHIQDCRDNGVFPALSPHAPYSVAPSLFHSLVDLAKSEQVPLCLHLAETKAELELLSTGTGELVEMLRKFGLWQDNLLLRGTKPLEYLMAMEDLPTASIAHGNYLSDEEVAYLGRHPNITTIYCPRTHHFFGHEPHPWQNLLDAGATVALGTDGRSSNPDYSLWAEVQFLDRKTDDKARPCLLKMATQSGAAALGATSAGTLEPGHEFLSTLIRLADTHLSNPWQLLLDSGSQPEPLPV